MRVDQYGVTRNAGNLCVRHGLGARRLGRNRKYGRDKKNGSGERAESAQGVFLSKIGLSSIITGESFQLPKNERTKENESKNMA